MSVKFSFGAENPPPLSAAGAGSRSPSADSSVLELRVTLVDGEWLRCEGVSRDEVSYASAEKQIGGEKDPGALAATLRSVLARCGAELPEPLIDSVSAITLSLAGLEIATLEALGLAVSPTLSPTSAALAVSAGAPMLAQVDEALQARTGVAAGTPIRLA